MCPFSHKIVIPGCVTSLLFIQICSLPPSLHTVSARWFVHICSIGAHSMRFVKCCVQPAVMPRCSMVHPAVCLSATHCRGSDAFPYVSACGSVWLCVCACMQLCLSLCFFYRGIQHKHSGETSTHHWLSCCWFGFPHCSGCHHHRL